MRPSLRVVSAISLVSFLSPAVAAPLYPVEILLKNGDAIAGVGLVTTIDNLAVTDSGSWVVQVDTDNPDTEVDSCLVKDGALLLRESKGATATPEGVALPHAMMEKMSRSFVAAMRLKGKVDFHSERCGPCDLVFVLVGPRNTAWEHVRILARIARVCSAPGALANLRKAKSAGDLYERLMKEDARHV